MSSFSIQITLLLRVSQLKTPQIYTLKRNFSIGDWGLCFCLFCLATRTSGTTVSDRTYTPMDFKYLWNCKKRGLEYIQFEWEVDIRQFLSRPRLPRFSKMFQGDRDNAPILSVTFSLHIFLSFSRISILSSFSAPFTNDSSIFFELPHVVSQG